MSLPALFNAPDVVIIAGGPSAAALDLNLLKCKDLYVLGCKDAFFNAPCHGCFTMDRRWNMHRVNRLREANAEVFASRKHWGFKPPPGFPYEPISPWDRVHFVKVDIYNRGLCEIPGQVNGRDSGFAALNLTWQYRPKRIFLIGFDLTMPPGGQEHWYPDHEWRKAKRDYSCGRDWVIDHEMAANRFQAEGVEVYNLSSNSIIDVYPKISYADAISMMRDAVNA